MSIVVNTSHELFFYFKVRRGGTLVLNERVQRLIEKEAELMEVLPQAMRGRKVSRLAIIDECDDLPQDFRMVNQKCEGKSKLCDQFPPL